MFSIFRLSPYRLRARLCKTECPQLLPKGLQCLLSSAPSLARTRLEAPLVRAKFEELAEENCCLRHRTAQGMSILGTDKGVTCTLPQAVTAAQKDTPAVRAGTKDPWRAHKANSTPVFNSSDNTRLTQQHHSSSMPDQRAVEPPLHLYSYPGDKRELLFLSSLHAPSPEAGWL